MAKINTLFEAEDVYQGQDKFDFKQEFGKIPTSVMEFDKSKELMSYIQDGDVNSIGDIGMKSKASLSGTAVRASIYIPDQVEFILKYYSRENDLILDPFSGRASRSQMCLKNKRRYVGYDTDPETIRLNKQLSERNGFKSEHYTFHCGDGTELKEYENDNNMFDMVISCPPYLQIEKYSGADGDLSYMTDDEFKNRIDEMFKHLYRLIKPSKYENDLNDEEEKAPIHLIAMTVGSKRDGKNGIIDMDYMFQESARKCGLVLWDKFITVNRSPFGAFTFRRNYKKSFVNKVHETTLFWAKFE